MSEKRGWRRWAGSLCVCAGLAGCADGETAQTATDAGEKEAGTQDAEREARPGLPVLDVPLHRREGQALARSTDDQALFVADEDHQVLHRVALTPRLKKAPALTDKERSEGNPAVSFGEATTKVVTLEGAPAQVFALPSAVLVTVRDPGLLIVVDPTTLQEKHRVELPYDAWGLSVRSDGQAAFVTSPWSNRVTKVDLAEMAIDWSVEVAREPRGVSVSADGTSVFVSHLMGTQVTRIDDGAEPSVRGVALPADPLRSHVDGPAPSASLGYALILDPTGRRVFAARHALGSLWAWQGHPTVDVLDVKTERPLAPERGGRPYGQLTREEIQSSPFWADRSGPFVESSGDQWFGPRAIAYREKTDHLIVASEGMARLVELDAKSVAPGVLGHRYYRLGGLQPKDPTKLQLPPHCGAPTGIALSEDEDVAWVYCRTTDNVVAVRLTDDGQRGVSDEIEFVQGGQFHERLSPWGPFAYASLPLSKEQQGRWSDPELHLGRRLFFDATDTVMSARSACAGCHPDGRDDGHVWHEIPALEQGVGSRQAHFQAGPMARGDLSADDPKQGAARQTPMLAGRVDAAGPYGWHAESGTLEQRIRAGFQLHRPFDHHTDGLSQAMRAKPLVRYLREGLVRPPNATSRTEDVDAGREVFLRPDTQCASCHAPDNEYTDRMAWPLRGFPILPSYDPDTSRDYKVPSLRYVANTAPYFHDGSAATLEAVVFDNQNRMGRTMHLTDEEKRQLVAFLRSL